jgi:hypothetical protein
VGNNNNIEELQINSMSSPINIWDQQQQIRSNEMHYSFLKSFKKQHSKNTQPKQRHTVPEPANAVQSGRLLMMGTRVPETCRAV